ncbi:hypothetical protein CTA2_12695 [Colletotrichum tanaceti]|nr:hypothetical protein CTA2_12695 [Colletotrichum tanaceti]
MTEPLTKVDSAVGGLSQSPPKEHKTRRQSSAAAPGVYNVKDLEEQKIELELAPETQRTGWKINTSSSTVEDKDILKLPLSNPPVKKIDLHFPLGMEVTARNLKGVTIKDALDAIHKAYKKRVRNPSFLRRQRAIVLTTYRRMMSSTSRTWQGSNGTRRSPGPGWSSTSRSSRQQGAATSVAAARRRRTRRQRVKSKRLSDLVRIWTNTSW